PLELCVTDGRSGREDLDRSNLGCPGERRFSPGDDADLVYAARSKFDRFWFAERDTSAFAEVCFSFQVAAVECGSRHFYGFSGVPAEDFAPSDPIEGVRSAALGA